VLRRTRGTDSDDIWQITDAGDQELRRLVHSSRRGTMELGDEHNDGLSQQARIVLAEVYTTSAGRRASAETDHALPRVPMTRPAVAF